MDRWMVYLLVIVAMQLNALAMALRLARSAHGGEIVWGFELVSVAVAAAATVASAARLYRVVRRRTAAP